MRPTSAEIFLLQVECDWQTLIAFFYHGQKLLKRGSFTIVKVSHFEALVVPIIPFRNITFQVGLPVALVHRWYFEKRGHEDFTSAVALLAAVSLQTSIAEIPRLIKCKVSHFASVHRWFTFMYDFSSAMNLMMWYFVKRKEAINVQKFPREPSLPAQRTLHDIIALFYQSCSLLPPPCPSAC